MKWRFTIIDRNGVSHAIDEPVGFDALEIEIKREFPSHGIMFNYQNNELKYYFKAKDLLKAEYDTYGSQGNMLLVIEESCDDTYTELYRGQFLFSKYVLVTGSECYVKISIENIGIVMDVVTKLDQKVDLASLKAFDGTTDLTAYPALNYDLLLPSKAILLQNNANSTINLTENVLGAGLFEQGGFNYSGQIGMFEIAMDKTIAAEIGGFYINPSPLYTPIKSGIENGTGYNLPPFTQGSDVYELPLPSTSIQKIHIWPKGTSSIVNWSDTLPNFQDKAISVDTAIRIKGKIKILNVQGAGSIAVVIVRLNKNNAPDYLLINYIHLNYLGVSDDLVSGDERTFDCNYTNANLVLQPNDQVYAFITITHSKTVAQASNTELDAFNINFDSESYWRMSTLSKSDPTTSKVFLVNETISRIAEAISNNQIRAYSNYFGRKDSLPYNQAYDGIGSLEALAKGIYIRNQQNRIPDKPNVFALSLNDLFDGLEPIHHIGYGIEDDPERLGYKRLRVEHWKFFYKNATVLSCVGVNSIERKLDESKLYSTCKFGYEKYEAEQYNGLDEFLTKRTYRTTLNGIKNEFNKLSKFIASGYAWEITRRKSTDSTDWRFDNDTFIVCVQRNPVLTGTVSVANFVQDDGSFLLIYNLNLANQTPVKIGDTIQITNAISNTGTYTITEIIIDATTNPIVWIDGSLKHLLSLKLSETVVDETISNGNYVIERKGFEVELGNVDNPTNIIDPSTIYNYRISPIRIAMRWMDTIAEGFKSNPSIIFTDGEGNYHASGKMHDAVGRLENESIAENATINNGVFAEIDDINPLFSPEVITFEYPLSVKEFKALLANPYEKIAFSNDYENGEGYISNVKYKPDEGMATFILIPKR